MSFDFKGATPEEQEKECKRIAQEMGDDRFFTKKELKYLPEVLADNEQVISFVSGLMDGRTWLIVLTDRRIIFLDKGMFFGLTQTSINLDKVNSVSGDTGILMGSISIEDGASTKEIKNVLKQTVPGFCNLVRDAIETRTRNAPANSAQAVASPESLSDRLVSLADLVTKGILTKDEFDKQKEKLLAE